MAPPPTCQFIRKVPSCRVLLFGVWSWPGPMAAERATEGVLAVGACICKAVDGVVSTAYRGSLEASLLRLLSQRLLVAVHERSLSWRPLLKRLLLPRWRCDVAAVERSLSKLRPRLLLLLLRWLWRAQLRPKLRSYFPSAVQPRALLPPPKGITSPPSSSVPNVGFRRSDVLRSSCSQLRSTPPQLRKSLP